MSDAFPTIPGYAIAELIGQGRAGTVWKATEEASGRIVALKVVPITDSVDAARFQRESRALEGLSHPHVVRRFASGRHGDALWLALEFLPDDVRRLLRRGLPPERAALAIARDAADGLAALAAAGLVHRDIAPSNILLGPDGRAKLGDLGLVREDGSAMLTRTGEVMGTPAYMSPEQARGEPVDERSDIYALGATLYELITGRPPFSGATPWAVVRQVATTPAPDPREIAPTVTAQARAIIRCAMARDAADRYADAGQMRGDLEAVLAGGVPSHAGSRRRRAAAAAATHEVAPPRADGKPIALAMGSIVVAALLGLFVGAMLLSSRGADAVAADAARVAATPAAWDAYLAAHPAGVAADEARAMLALHQRLAASAGPTVDVADLRRQAERLRADAARVAQEIADTRAQIDKVRATPKATPKSAELPVVHPTSATPEPAVAKPIVVEKPATPIRAQIPRSLNLEDVAVGEPTASLIASRATLASLGMQVDLRGITCDPKDPLVAYAWNSSRSMWRTEDGGVTWTEVHSEVSLGTFRGNPQWLADGSAFFIGSYDSTTAGFWCSDRGATRVRIPAPAVIDPKDPGKGQLTTDRLMLPDGSLYCVVRTGSGMDFSGTVYRSSDHGGSWVAQGDPIRRLWTMHSYADLLLLACMTDGGGLRCSIDLGGTWFETPRDRTDISTSSDSPWCAGADRIVVAHYDNVEEYALDGRVLGHTKLPDAMVKANQTGGIQAIAVDPLDHDTWYLAGIGLGLQRSVDHGRTWHGYPMLMRAHTYNRAALAFTSGSKPRLLVAVADAVLSIDDDGHPAALFPIAPETVAKPGRTAEPEDLPVAAATAVVIAKRVVRTSLGPGSALGGISCHPRDPQVALVWNDHAGIWRTADGGTTWTKASPDRSEHDNAMVSACWSSDAKLVFIPSVGDSVGKLLSDGFKTVEIVSGPWPAPQSGDKNRVTKVYERAMAPNGDLFCAWTANKEFGGPCTLCRSADHGRTWKTVGNPIPRMWGLYRTSKGILLERSTEKSDGYEFSGDLGATWKFCAPASDLTGGRSGMPTWNLTDRMLLAGDAEVKEIGPDGVQLGSTVIPGEFKEVSNHYYFAGFAVDPRNPDVWYASGAELGLLRSTDHGKNWFGYPLVVHRRGNDRMALAFTAGPKPRLMVTIGESVLAIDDEGWPAELFPIPLVDVMKHVRDGWKP